MFNRRDFLKTTTAAGGALLLGSKGLFGDTSNSVTDYFSVHPFIESNPDAVFIMKTNVDVKTNSEAVKQAGLKFGQSVFNLTNDDQIGVPLSHLFPIKPNLTSRGRWSDRYTVEGTMGVVTDAYFVEGVIESMKALGIRADHIFVREVNGTENMTDGGYGPMGIRTGADVQVINNKVTTLSDEQVVWKDVPDGVWFKKIPYLWPINAPNSWLLNISKFKAHGMGLTLCAKNLQGSIAAYYQQHCTNYYSNMDMLVEDIQSDAKLVIMDNWERHADEGIPRWDILGVDVDALTMETWATRCLDNNSVTKPGLHIIEGVYGRDGNGFVYGPHDGLAKDYMTNIIIFGKNGFYVDVIGHWLGGHEPGNLGLFHLAKERDFIDHFNPHNIPVYEWNEHGVATLKSLTDFERSDLVTYYIQRPDEDYYHLVNEPYDYYSTSVSTNNSKPESHVLQQNYPNPFNQSTKIQFSLPQSGHARLEIFNERGEVVDVLHDRFTTKGSHMAVWNSSHFPSGPYFYRFCSGSFSEIKKMILVR